jgi:hypothetical protein
MSSTQSHQPKSPIETRLALEVLCKRAAFVEGRKKPPCPRQSSAVVWPGASYAALFLARGVAIRINGRSPNIAERVCVQLDAP